MSDGLAALGHAHDSLTDSNPLPALVWTIPQRGSRIEDKANSDFIDVHQRDCLWEEILTSLHSRLPVQFSAADILVEAKRTVYNHGI